MAIRISYEDERGCGFRKPGGLYIVCDSPGKSCNKLPIELTTCPCCGGGIKPARGWTWVGWELIKDAPCSNPGCNGCIPFDGSQARFGLIWIGESFYPTPDAFTRESLRLGISRRINNVPRDFKIGESWVLLAHRKVHFGQYDETSEMLVPIYSPGIFTAFCPDRIEYIIREDDSPERLAEIESRGISLVHVVSNDLRFDFDDEEGLE